jgi:HSP20 family protein
METQAPSSVGTLVLTVPNGIPNPTAEGTTAPRVMLSIPQQTPRGSNMFTTFPDPFNALLDLQRALEARLASDWLQDSTTSRGPFPPINMFQQGDDIVAIIELPGIDRNELHIDARENTIRIWGRKAINFSEGVSVHRRERISGEFDRTLSFPVQLDPDGIKAEYRDGILALFLPRAETDKPRTIAIK